MTLDDRRRVSARFHDRRARRDPLSKPVPEPPRRLILADEGILERLGTRTERGEKITAEWGEPDEHGWYTPTFTVHYDDVRTAPTFAEMLLTAHYRHTTDCPGEPCSCHYFEDLAVIRAALASRDHPLGAKAMVEHPPGPPDAPKREYPEPMA